MKGYDEGVEVDCRAGVADDKIDNPSPYRQRQHHHQGNKNKQRVKLRAIPIPAFIQASPKLTS